MNKKLLVWLMVAFFGLGCGAGMFWWMMRPDYKDLLASTNALQASAILVMDDNASYLRDHYRFLELVHRHKKRMNRRQLAAAETTCARLQEMDQALLQLAEAEEYITKRIPKFRDSRWRADLEEMPVMQKRRAAVMVARDRFIECSHVLDAALQ